MAVLDRPDPVTSGTTVRLVRKCAVDEGTDEPGVRSGPTAEGVRREIGTLARCTSTGVAVLVAHGERPVPWLETEDAGVHTLESPPDSAGRRIGVLAALTHVLAGLHRDGWAHLGLEPGHVIWRDRAPGGRPPPGESAPPEVTLCSLGSAVHPAGPAERYADREALAQLLASAMAAPSTRPPGRRVRADVAALAEELRSGALGDLAAAAVALDDLAEAARRDGPIGSGSPTTATAPAVRPPAPAARTEWLGRFRHRVTGRRFTPVRVALGLAAIAALGVGATLLATRNETPPPSGRASPPCSTPIVPPPRVDPTGLGCGVPAGYRSGVLTLGANSWSLGDDVVDGRLVDTDADGWSELVALRDTGEVFLVRRFPTEASQPVRVRSVASVPGADRVTVTNGISGPAAVGLRLPDGSVAPLNEAISVSTAPATPQAGSS